MPRECDADFVVFDPEAEFVVTPERLHHRHAVSPYMGERLRGMVQGDVRARQAGVSPAAEFPGAPTGKRIPALGPKPERIRRTKLGGFSFTIAGPHHESAATIGVSAPRKEGRDKVTGRARYIDDISLPDMLYGATVRSSIPRGKIRKINFGPGIDWDEFVVVTAKDIPGKNYIALIENDQPCLADGRVNHPEEPILLLAHPDRHVLPKAVAAVRDRIRRAAVDFHASRRASDSTQVIWGEDNIFKSYLIEKGDVDAVWAKADSHRRRRILDRRAGTALHRDERSRSRRYDAEATASRSGDRCNVPYYVHKALMALFGLPEDKVRVVQTETGGAFGGKEDYPSMIAGARGAAGDEVGAAGENHLRPRGGHGGDDEAASVADAASHGGDERTERLLGGEIEFGVDGGAYSTLSSMVLSRATIHAGGPYYWPNMRVRSKALATNAPPHGAFRGFGAPQSLFAMERHMDRIAKAVGLSPEEFRRRNLLKHGRDNDYGAGDSRARSIWEDAGARARCTPTTARRRERFARENTDSASKKGIGIAAFLHGAGFTGSGERYLNSLVGVDATAEGRVRVLVSSTEFGQGTNTILCQIAAETLGIDLRRCRRSRRRTRALCRTAGRRWPRVRRWWWGSWWHRRRWGLKQTLIASGLLGEAYTSGGISQTARRTTSRSTERFVLDEPLRGSAGMFTGTTRSIAARPMRRSAWAVYVAEVTVDLTTYSVTVDDFVALQEVGRVLNPVLARGQIVGGVAQGIGFALYEKVVWRRRAYAEQPDDELHHADLRGPAADSRVL